MAIVAGLWVTAAAVIAAVFALAVARVIRRKARGGGKASSPRRTASGYGLEELHALLSAGKRVQLEQQAAERVLRDEDRSAAPGGVTVNLDAGTAMIRRR
jgi:hypothetical protein